MLVDEILDQKGRHLYEVSPDWPISKAAAMLAAWNVGTTIVTDFNGALVGIISERDIVRSLNEFGGNVLRIPVRDLMTRSVITCSPQTTISAALSLMALHRIRHLPVSQDEKIIGVISVRDLMQTRLETMEEHVASLVRAEQEAERARAEAERASLAKTEFLAHMSHELRTPLNAVIGFSDVIAGGFLGPDASTTYRQYATHINVAGRHLLKLVNEVLDLSKVVAGQLELEEDLVDLDTLLHECADLLALQLKQKQLTLSITIPEGEPVSLMADALRLRQVLLNLLSNAIKFSRAGDAVDVHVRATRNGDLTIAVSDHGVGMRKEDIPVALEPFRQIGGDPEHAHEGTGLGLPLAKILVEKHGGALTVKSALGEGTTVFITIPGWRIDRTVAPRILEVG